MLTPNPFLLCSSCSYIHKIIITNLLIMAHNLYPLEYPVAAQGGFLGFLETSQDSGSTDQIVNTDGPLPAAVTVNKTP